MDQKTPKEQEGIRQSAVRTALVVLALCFTLAVLGRGLSERDAPGAPALAVVNQEFAKRVFPGQNPIERYFGPSPASAEDYSAP